MNRGNNQLSIKRIAITKDQARIVITIALTASILAFSLVASRVLISKMNHQSKVIDAKEEALTQLEQNVGQAKSLESAYLTFENAEESILGNPNEKNSRVILDALPSKYDYAAVLTTIEAILQQGTYTLDELSGVDQELEALQESSVPEPVEIPISLRVTTTYVGASQLINDLNRTIRPMNIRSLTYSGDDGDLTLDLDIVTYYQPEKKLDVAPKEIK